MKFTANNLQDEYERETGSETGGRGSEDFQNISKKNHGMHIIAITITDIILNVSSIMLVLQGRQWEESCGVLSED